MRNLIKNHMVNVIWGVIFLIFSCVILSAADPEPAFNTNNRIAFEAKHFYFQVSLFQPFYLGAAGFNGEISGAISNKIGFNLGILTLSDECNQDFMLSPTVSVHNLGNWKNTDAYFFGGVIFGSGNLLSGDDCTHLLLPRVGGGINWRFASRVMLNVKVSFIIPCLIPIPDIGIAYCF